MWNWSISIVKQAAAATIISLANYALTHILGIPTEYIQNIWGFACFIVFMDAMVLQHDFKLLQSQKQDAEERFKFLQSLFQHLHSTQVLTLDKNTSQISELDLKLEKLTTEIMSRSNSDSFSSSFADNNPVSPVQKNVPKIESSDSECEVSSATETEDHAEAKSPAKTYSLDIQKARRALVLAKSLNLDCGYPLKKKRRSSDSKSMSPQIRTQISIKNNKPESFYNDHFFGFGHKSL